MKRTVKKMVFSFLALHALGGLAADVTYLSGDPAEDASWQGGVAPTATDNVLFTGNGATTFPVAKDLTYANFTASDSARVLNVTTNVNEDASVTTNVLNLTGKLSIASPEFTVTGGGIVTSATYAVSSATKLTLDEGA